MSHFAQVINGIVTQVIVAEQDFIDTLPNSNTWIQTSYNTKAGVHYNPINQTPDNGVALRANFAGIGDIYDVTHDVFYAPRPLDRNGEPCNSWTISAPKWTWTPPTPMPTSTTTPPTFYAWDEPTKSWIVVSSTHTT